MKGAFLTFVIQGISLFMMGSPPGGSLDGGGSEGSRMSSNSSGVDSFPAYCHTSSSLLSWESWNSSSLFGEKSMSLSDGLGGGEGGGISNILPIISMRALIFGPTFQSFFLALSWKRFVKDGLLAVMMFFLRSCWLVNEKCPYTLFLIAGLASRYFAVLMNIAA